MHPDETRLRHMLDATHEALSFVSGKTRADVVSNRILVLALIQLLEIIGEAANGISDGLRNNHQEIPWNSIIKMRHRLIHGYFDVDEDIIWQTISNDLPLLRKYLESIVTDFKE
ncbi:MAG: HepT-like ribonuclease domain-containing protein [Candidatus Thorarchaeota archaeon]